jgi:predicted membrane chloride channel (bestrophin family)
LAPIRWLTTLRCTSPVGRGAETVHWGGQRSLARLNHRKEALEILAKLSRLAEAGYVDPNALAQVQIALNDTDSAITSVGRILEERVPFAFFIKLDPEFDPLRPDARFSDLVLRLGI